MIIEYVYSHKSRSLYLITRRATVAAMAESVSTWSMRMPKTDSVGRVDVICDIQLLRMREILLPHNNDIAVTITQHWKSYIVSRQRTNKAQH